MQVFTKRYNDEDHDEFKAITVKQPFADSLLYGMRIILREKETSFRGDVVVCSSLETMPGYPNVNSSRKGRTICSGEIVDCVKVSELTADQWKILAKLPLSEKSKYRHVFALIFKFHKELINVPVVSKPCIWNLVVKKGTLVANELKKSDNEFFGKMYNWICAIIIIILLTVIMLTIKP